MRVRLTLDEDVAEHLRGTCMRTGRTFSEEANEALRRGLQSARATDRGRFRVVTRNMGALRAGMQIDQVGKLVEAAEGPLTR